MLKLMKTKRSKKKVVTPLSEKNCDELILCCALKAYNTLALGKPKKLKDQYKTMETFHYGRNQTILFKSSYYVLPHIHI